MEPRSSFVGRARELVELGERLVDGPLLTVVGPGGVGKTRLALRAAAGVGQEFPDGVRIVELGAVRADEEVTGPIATALGYGSFAATLDALVDETTLIVLDNCEHVLDELAPVVDTLLKTCVDVRILATSRAPLELDGEVVIPLAPLSEDDALGLLRDRAASAGARLEADEDVDRELAALVRGLDGLPLALELAAMRLRSLTPADVLSALDAGGEVPRPTRQPRASRHDSLQRTIAWSYDLLDDDLAASFRRLAVFEAPFTVEHAHAVIARAEDTLLTTADAIDRLHAASMIVRRPGGSPTTYHLLETLRRFAAAELISRGELAEARARYLDFVADRAGDIVSRGTSQWSEELVDDALTLAPDLLVALRLCLDTDDDARRAVALLVPAWAVIHHRQASEFADIGAAVLQRWSDPTVPWWADAAAVTANSFLRIGQQHDAADYANTALAAGGGLVGEPIARRVLAMLHQYRGEWDRTLAEIDRAIEVAEQLGLTPFCDELRVMATTVTAQRGDLAEALRLATAARERAAERWTATVGPWTIVQEAYLQALAEPERAEELLTATVASVGGIDLHPNAIRHLGIMALRAGDLSGAAAWLRRAFDEARAHSDLPHRWAATRWIAIAASRLDGTARARAGSILATTESEPHCPAVGELHRGDLAEAMQRTGRSAPIRGEAVIECVHELLDAIASPDLAGPTGAAPHAPPPELVAAGDVWTIGWDGETSQVAATKGIADIARLVTNPEQDVHALDLMGALADQSGTDQGIDGSARRRYEERLRELQADLEEAEANHDTARAERCQVEFDQIVDALTSAFGLGGRQRTTGDAAERARSAVTWRIRAAIKKIDQQLPGMARHLRRSIKTGTWCRYAPERPVAWITDRSVPASAER